MSAEGGPDPSGPLVNDAVAAKDILPVVARNLRRLRTCKGHSLERLARASGVSRAMLGQIELAQSAPSINVLWRIATALEVPFSALLGGDGEAPSTILRSADGASLRSADGTFSSRPLFPFGQGPRRSEFYELRLAAGAAERASAHPAGTLENLVITAGRVAVELGAERHVLDVGDAIVFRADVPHGYVSAAEVESVMYLVMTYTLAAE